MSRIHARSAVTSDDYSSIPFVISCLVGITNVLAVGTQFATKSWMKRVPGVDDGTIALSLLFSIGMIVCTCWASENGLGKAHSTLDSAQLTKIAKITYAGNLLYIATLFFSKASMLIIVKFLTPFSGLLRAVWATAAVLVAWTVSALFVAAFQCSVPHVWNTVDGKCLNLQAFWTYYDVVNILLEISTSVIPIMVVYPIQIARDRRRVIIAIFLLRIFVLAPIIAGMVFRYQSHPDPILAQWQAAVSTQLVQCFSIVFACVPFLKPFFAELETGMVRLDDTRRMASRTTTLASRSGNSQSAAAVSAAGKKVSRKLSHSVSQSWAEVSSGHDKPSPEPLVANTGDVSETGSNHIYTMTTYSVMEEPNAEEKAL